MIGDDPKGRSSSPASLAPTAADEAACVEYERRILADAERLPPAVKAAAEQAVAADRVRRTALYAERARYPVIADQDVGDPILVTGLPRSGTTLLHGLLAQDPRARSPLVWQTGEWSPPPGLDPEADARRIAQAYAEVAQIPQEMLARHSKGALLPEECGGVLMNLAFAGTAVPAIFGIDANRDWLAREADLSAAMRLHRHALQHLQAFTSGDWWVLKNPPDLFRLDARFAEYPGTRLVWSHRDPAAVLPSNASLIQYAQQLNGLDPDPQQLGADLVEYWAEAIDRAMAFRAGHPRQEQFVDVHHTDLSRDAIGVARRIYDQFGMTLTPEAETAMRVYMANNRKGKHGAHSYSPEQFGLTAEGLHKRFAKYIETFDVEIGR